MATIDPTTTTRTGSGRLSWLLPSLRGYQRGWIRGDVLGGLAAGTVVIPQAMAYATIADLPVQIGLYTCMVPAVIYALLGGARTISVSTTSTIAVLVATTLAGLPAAVKQSDPQLLRAAFTLTFLVGICLLLMRLLRLGALVEIISPATQTGIRVGVGLTVIASQLPSLLGLTTGDSDGGFFAKIANVIAHLASADPVTTVIALIAVALMLVLQKVAPRVPAQLAVVLASIVLVALTPIENNGSGPGLTLITKVPTGLPVPQLPVVGDLLHLLPGAFAISIMALLETVVVARTTRRRDEPPIDVDRELLAIGVSSIGGGLSQTMPPAGGFSQSAVNARAGARTQLAALVMVVLAILVALFLAPVLDDLPKAILAAMVMVAMIGLLKPGEFFLYARIDRAELWVAIAVAAVGLTAGMLMGVAVGIVLTLALVVRNVNRARVRPLYRSVADGWTTNPPAAASDQPPATGGDDHSPARAGSADQPPAAPPIPILDGGIVVLHLDGSLYAGNSTSTADAVMLAAGSESVRAVVLEGTAVREVTVPLVQTLQQLDENLAKTDVQLVVAALPRSTEQILARSDWFAGYRDDGWVAPTVDAAVELLRGSEPIDRQGPR